MRLIFFFLLTLISQTTGHAAEVRPPNIVFFLVDDLGWSDVGCFGSSFYETPNIDRLATEGVKFTHAYAACHVCSPTRASILTGKYPASLKLTDWLPGRKDFSSQRLLNAGIQQHLPYDEITLAEVLKGQGYGTAIFGKWHLGVEPSDPMAHGFDLHIPEVPSNWRTFHGPFGMKTLESKKGDYLTDRLTDEALGYMEKQKDRPFFLYLSHFAVHDPIHGRKDLVEKYQRKLAASSRPTGDDFILEGNPDDPDPLSREELDAMIERPAFSGFKVLPKHTVKIKQRQDNVEFAAMVEAVDDSLGRVLAKLEELGLTNETLVVFFSDNGGMSAGNFGNPERIIAKDQLDKAFSTSNLPLRGAKGWLYEGGIRVPLIVKWPGAGKAGTVCEEPVISTDMLPTLLEMAGLEDVASGGRDGVSFASAVKGEAFERGAIYWHFPHYSNHGMQSPGGAIREGDWKLLEYFENGTVQLFNLREDIGEQNDLAGKMPKKVAELKQKLASWRTSVSASMMPPNPDYQPTQP